MTPVMETLSAHRSIRKFSGRPVAPDLHIPEHAYPVFGMCLGYPDDDPEPRPRLPLDMVFHQDRFPETVNEQGLNAYDDIIQAYYENRAPELKNRTWSRVMADFTSQVIRPHIKVFLEKKGFLIQ